MADLTKLMSVMLCVALIFGCTMDAQRHAPPPQPLSCSRFYLSPAINGICMQPVMPSCVYLESDLFRSKVDFDYCRCHVVNLELQLNEWMACVKEKLVEELKERIETMVELHNCRVQLVNDWAECSEQAIEKEPLNEKRMVIDRYNCKVKLGEPCKYKSDYAGSQYKVYMPSIPFCFIRDPSDSGVDNYSFDVAMYDTCGPDVKKYINNLPSWGRKFLMDKELEAVRMNNEAVRTFNIRAGKPVISY